jgi:hypothetical protein
MSQQKKLPPMYLTNQYRADQRFNSYFLELPLGHKFEDLFAPGYWSHHARLQKNDMIRVTDAARSFDIWLTVERKPQAGAVVAVFPKYPSGTGIDAATDAAKSAALARPSTVPILANGKLSIRVNHTPATKWRVITMDGSTLSQGHEVREDAERVMVKHLAELNLTMPSDEVIAEAVAKAKADEAERRKPRATAAA